MKNSIIRNSANYMDSVLKAYFPRLRAKIFYYFAYGKKCDLKNPKTFSEKMLWLSLNTYRNNKLVLDLCDKYLVRKYIKNKIGEEYLNKMYFVCERLEDIDYDKLPNSFALKVSQGCTTNILCRDKNNYSKEKFQKIITEWGRKQNLYDKMMADIGGVDIKNFKKYYLCEGFLVDANKNSPTDYKIYCFNGVPKAILVINDRFENKNGLFMNTEWELLSTLNGSYLKPAKIYPKPKSLEKMIEIARTLSKDFPFVRVDLYDIAGKVVFGELTFFPNGCIKMQETDIAGKSMGELLDISDYINQK